MPAPRVLSTALALAVLSACTARTLTSTEETVEAGTVARLKVEVRASVVPLSSTKVTPTLCAALPSSWPEPSVIYARNDDEPQAAMPTDNAAAVAHRDVSGEGLAWHCFTVTKAMMVSVAEAAEGGQVEVSVPVPEDAQGSHTVRTLGLWKVDENDQFDEAQHRLRVETAPTDTFDVWNAAPWRSQFSDAAEVWHGDRFVTFNDEVLFCTDDGVSWTNTEVVLSSVTSLAYGHGVWVGVAWRPGHLGRLDMSASPPAWHTVFPSAVKMRDVVFAHGLFVAVGEEGLVLTSPDGTTWTARASGAGGDLRRVAASPDGFLAMGDSVAALSPDGVTWSAVSLDQSWFPERLVYGNGRWLALVWNEDQSDTLVVESTDGTRWQPVASLQHEPAPLGVWFVDGRFVVTYVHQTLYGSGTSGWAPLFIGYSGRLGGFAQNDERVVVTGAWGFAASAMRRIPAAPELFTRFLAPAIIGTPYAAPLAATGGEGAVTIELVDGALPPGLSIEREVITGTPTQTGTFDFTLSAVDAAGGTGTKAFTLEVGDPLRLPETKTFYVMPGGGAEVRIPIQGGAPPYEIEVTAAATQATVAGSEAVLVFSLSASETAAFTLTVTDDEGQTATREYEVLALEQEQIIGGNSEDVVAGRRWGAEFKMADPVPAQWLIEGALPAGLVARSEETRLVIEGTYRGEVEGEYPITLTVTDVLGRTATLQETLTVVVPPRPSVSELPAAIVGQPYEFEVQARLGHGPIAWDIDEDLPEGLAWTQTDGGWTVSGTAEQTGVFYQVIQLTDARGLEAAYELTLGVGEALTVTQPTPTLAVVGHAYELKFDSPQGAAPYRYSVTGELPPGLATTLEGDAFGLKGVPLQAGTYAFTVTVTDKLSVSASWDEAVVLVVTEPRLTATTLPTAIVEVPYTATIEVTDGTAPFAFSHEGDLPDGLTLLADGTVEGKATEAGEFSIEVTVTDAHGLTATAFFELTAKVSPPPQMVSPELSLAVVGEPFEAVYEATSGLSPMTWTHTGDLPDGLSFTVEDGTYLLSGTPTAAGSYAFEVTVTDTYGFQDVSGTQTIEVVSKPTVTTETLADGKVSVAYEATVEATLGTAPYVWSHTGELPEGLTFEENDGDYVLSGTPTAAGQFTFTVKVTDAHDLEDTRVFSLTIAPADPIDEEPDDEEPKDEEPKDEEPSDEEPPAAEEKTGCGGCDATGATSLLALAALGLLRRRR